MYQNGSIISDKCIILICNPKRKPDVDDKKILCATFATFL